MAATTTVDSLVDAIVSQPAFDRVRPGFIGRLEGWQVFHHSRTICLSHAEWEKGDAERLRRFLSREGLPWSLGYWQHYTQGDSVPCVWIGIPQLIPGLQEHRVTGEHLRKALRNLEERLRDYRRYIEYGSKTTLT